MSNKSVFRTVNEIAIVENVDSLSVNIKCKLNFERLINKKIAKGNARLISFARIRKMLDVYRCVSL